jgi:hypothetical protein
MHPHAAHSWQPFHWLAVMKARVGFERWDVHTARMGVTRIDGNTVPSQGEVAWSPSFHIHWGKGSCVFSFPIHDQGRENRIPLEGMRSDLHKNSQQEDLLEGWSWAGWVHVCMCELACP